MTSENYHTLPNNGRKIPSCTQQKEMETINRKARHLKNEGTCPQVLCPTPQACQHRYLAHSAALQHSNSSFIYSQIAMIHETIKKHNFLSINHSTADEVVHSKNEVSLETMQN
jgi:hypothetical protein